jgi:hypothetical protein
MKTAADKKRYVKPIDIQIGDRVLCRQAKQRKHDTKYTSDVMTAVKRKGSLIVAQSRTNNIT